MKEKQGFTLIELLAVIVILAIIALISTPIVLNIINTSRKGAFVRSAEGVLKASKLYYSSSLLNIEGVTDVTFWCDNNECISDKKDDNGDSIKLDVDGNMGIGDIEIYSDGTISLSLSDGTYCVEKKQEDSKITVTKKNCIKDKIENKTYTTGDAVTLGGYKWHVIGDTGTQVTLLMDANQLGDNSKMAHCTNDTDASTDCGVDSTGTYYVYSWDKSLIRTYLNGQFLTDLKSKLSNEIVPIRVCVDSSRGDDVITYGGYLKIEIDNISGASCGNGYETDYVRLITNSEYWNLSPYYSGTNLSYPNVSGITRLSASSDYANWLYCNSNQCGIWWWTMASFSANNTSIVKSAFTVHSYGGLENNYSQHAYSIRPVITIVK